ncbi:hypothetical protein A9K97_gp297 [Tokyovirus A1]|uniref:hypothetical protein n=1 Tax=Tokyovirus A1 TaxID=1826170 RepID=UPI0007A9910D|nr:hypothetical protein A9K97_gp297 [Tokyovirus A1]BAU80054.1 hypothetical protein [Tokyovirus A1]
MEEFLEKKELVSFSVSSSSFPQKEKFLRQVIGLNKERTEFWTVLPDGTTVHLESVSGNTFLCPYKDGNPHGDFEYNWEGFKERRTGSFKRGKAHGSFFVWDNERISLTATFVDGEILEMESRFRKFLFSRNKKRRTLHILFWERNGDRLVIEKKLMMNASQSNSVFSCPFVPFGKEPLFTFAKQTLLETEYFPDRPSEEKVSESWENMFSVD